MSTAVVIVVVVIALLVIAAVAKAVLIVPRDTAVVIERMSQFHKIARSGMNFLVPFVDCVRARVDLREQRMELPAQALTAEDNRALSASATIYFRVDDSRAAVYEISNYIVGVEQLTTTTLRNLVGNMSTEQLDAPGENVSNWFRCVLDEATGRWGIRVTAAELSTALVSGVVMASPIEHDKP